MRKIIKCHKCDMGGNGNAKNKCSCGCEIEEKTSLGCFFGEPIKGEIKPKKKLSKSKQRYQRYLEYGDMFNSFLDFCYWDAKPERCWNS